MRLHLPCLFFSLATSSASAFHIVNSNSPTPSSRRASIVLSSTASNNKAASAELEDRRETRRDVLQRTTATLASTLLAISTSSAATAAIVQPRPANADVIRSPGKCANGEGEGCDALSENNEFIRSLQRRSSTNREFNQREALNAYYMKNYPDVFAVSEKRMVKKKADGSFALFSAEEVSELMNEGKIKIEYPRSKGGRIADLTQKPVLVLQ